MVAVSSGTVELQANRIKMPKSKSTIRKTKDFGEGFIS
jgi:hypothetical protein